MLGGSFWIALLRNGMIAALMMGVFLLLDRPRFCMRGTILGYLLYGSLLSIGYSIWYWHDLESYIRFSGLSSLFLIGIFCTCMSSERIYLSIYKMSLAFYLLSACVVFGIDISRLWFGSSFWVDLFVRFCMIIAILYFVKQKFRRIFLSNLEFLSRELDLFSVVALVVSVLLASLIVYWPTERRLSGANIMRLLASLFMAGVIQYTIFHLYIHLGKENGYKEENRLLAMNEQLLRCQLTLAEEAEEKADQIRHDTRHHCLLIREYVKRGETSQLLFYLDQYLEDVDSIRVDKFCTNKAVDGILSAYASLAKRQGIRTEIHAAVGENLPVRDIDLIAILANILENAVNSCRSAGVEDTNIRMQISQKGHKIVIQCKNTMERASIESKGARLQESRSSGRKQGRLQMKPEKQYQEGIGMASIRKTAQRYHGETDFVVADGMFVTRVLLNLEGGPKAAAQPDPRG